MLKSHLNAMENVLLARGRIASNAGHPNLIGSPREWFIRDFLAELLPETIKVGQGEIIDSRSQPKEKRNQTDIVLYRRDFPKITYSPNDSAFLRESVVATVEVKSTIDIGELKKACEASINQKNRRYIQKPDPKRPLHPVGVIEDLRLPSIATYVVSYKGPHCLSTVANWFPTIKNELTKTPDQMIEKNELTITPDQMIDMLIILGEGIVWRVDSFPPLGRQLKLRYPEGTWAFLEQENKNLLLLFLHILYLTSPIGDMILEYVKDVPFEKIQIIE